MPEPSTVFKWLVDFPEFSEQYARAREAQMEAMAEDILEIADEKPECTTEGDGWSKTSIDNAGVNRNRVRVDARKWLMSKMAPKKYGDNAQLNVTGEITLGIGELLTTARQRMLAAKTEPPTLDGQLDGQNEE